MAKNPDIEFLNSQLVRLQEVYQTLQELCTQDLLPPGDSLPQTSEDEERCARLADDHDLNGSLFRNLLPPPRDPDSVNFQLLLNRLHQQIRMIPCIIAAIESAEKKRQACTIPPEKLSRHYSPKELRRILGMSQDKLKKMLDSGKIRHIKHTTKDYQIHLDDLPSDKN